MKSIGGTRFGKRLLRALAARLEPQLLASLEQHLSPRLEQQLLDRLAPKLAELERDKPWKKNLFVPSIDVYEADEDSPFMAYSTCSSRDFFHPEFKRIFSGMNFGPFFFHRKYWEWVYIAHHLKNSATAGKRGLGFGVGATEPLTAVFAGGARIMATDAPEAIAVGAGWNNQGSFASGPEALPCEGILDRGTFRERVAFSEWDMNAIPAGLTGYDFCWSSCCLEHLGNLRKGMDFVINSVEKTLKIGGIACHTTEFNLSSNDKTVESGPTVLYRRCDIETLIDELSARGHEVGELRVAPDSLVIDGYVDTPPYGPPAHLKLDLYGFTATSMGMVIRRGR